MSQNVLTPTTAPAPAAVRPAPRTAFAILKIGVLALEVLIVTFAVLGRLDILSAIAAHFALAAALLVAIVVAERLNYYAGDLQKFMLQMLVAGPLGSASALIDEQLSTRLRPEILAKWYDTIAPQPQAAVTLADRIRDDQVVRPRAKLPRSVNRLIVKGSMREKQALFATVVADGRLEGVNLIEKALRSRDQQVRVQAAAVSAFLRSKVRTSTGTGHAFPTKPRLPSGRMTQRAVIAKDMTNPAA
jgi:hypothetical protein